MSLDMDLILIIPDDSTIQLCKLLLKQILTFFGQPKASSSFFLAHLRTCVVRKKHYLSDDVSKHKIR